MWKGVRIVQFYSYAYLVSHPQSGHILQYALIFFGLIFWAVICINHLQHRLVTRYRDLSIIFLLMVFFALIVQINDYNHDRDDEIHASQIAAFVHSLSQNLNVPTDSILTNSLILQNGMIVRVDGTFYQVTFTTDSSAYSLHEVMLQNPDIQIDKDR